MSDTLQKDLDTYWCNEFYDCVNLTFKSGTAKGYPPRNWEKPDGMSVQHPKNCDSMFHHLAREYVAKELSPLIDGTREQLTETSSVVFREHSGNSPEDIQTNIAMARLEDIVNKLLVSVTHDHESGLKHTQHLATRALMDYTREVRDLDKVNKTYVYSTNKLGQHVFPASVTFEDDEDNKGGFKGVF